MSNDLPSHLHIHSFTSLIIFKSKSVQVGHIFFTSSLSVHYFHTILNVSAQHVTSPLITLSKVLFFWQLSCARLYISIYRKLSNIMENCHENAVLGIQQCKKLKVENVRTNSRDLKTNLAVQEVRLSSTNPQSLQLFSTLSSHKKHYRIQALEFLITEHIFGEIQT